MIRDSRSSSMLPMLASDMLASDTRSILGQRRRLGRKSPRPRVCV
jgi:hypothetical protein